MKKHLFLLLAVALGFAACQPKSDGFKVQLDLKNGNGIMVYLQKHVDDKTVTVDSAIIADEMAVLNAPSDNPQRFYELRMDGMRGAILFFPDNKDITIMADLQNPMAFQILGSETQTQFNEYQDQMKVFNNEIQSLMEILYANPDDENLLDSISQIGQQLMREQEDFTTNYINEHADSFLAHYLLNETKQDYDIAQLKEMVANITTSSIYLDKITAYISEMERLEIGKPFIDFTLATAEGENITLSEVIKSNKITMIDFWASWCGPCRQENPVVKAAYEKYHDMGLEVLAISVDRDAAAWMKAVEQDELPYLQVRDTEDVAGRYLVHYIPSNFLFDAEGCIIAKGLRGEELNEKLAELLQ